MMANYWAIAIGINQYQHLQPLMYAQRDAQALRDFFIREARFPSKQCFLLTDSFLRRNRTETSPTRESIEACIARTCQQRLQPNDFLWCFFSGYGMRFEGKDYLMPMAGDPAQVATTGIPIELLFSIFETAPTRNIFLVLDVNRSQNASFAEGVGDQTLLLAREHGIPTLLSCPPHQFSHETLALRQGLFTAAVLEGIRQQGCLTPGQLVQFLSDRLPELSEQHWRPRQDLLAFVPAEKKYQLIVPKEAAISLGAAIETPVEVDDRAVASNGGGASQNGHLAERSWNSLQSSNLSDLSFPTALLDAGWDSPTPSTPDLQETIPQSAAMRRPELLPEQVGSADELFWRRLLIWSSMIAAALLIGVVLRNSGELVRDGSTVSTSEASPITQSEGAAGDADEVISQPAIQAEPGSALEAAYIAVRIRDFNEAKFQLSQVPAAERNAEYTQVLEQANKGLLSDAKVLLTRTRELTTENQAADFVEAINLAQQIQPGEPQYEEAQQYINRWSHVIFDMAQGRADRRNGSSTSIAAENYSKAIATVRLIPANTDVFQQGQEAIAQWSQRILDLANHRASEGMYDVAIQAAELIPADAPAYEPAQAAIAEWREKPTLLVVPTPGHGQD